MAENTECSKARCFNNVILKYCCSVRAEPNEQAIYSTNLAAQKSFNTYGVVV